VHFRHSSDSWWREAGVLVATMSFVTWMLSGCARHEAADGVTREAVIQPQIASITVPAGVDYKGLAVGAASGLTVSDRAQLLGPTPGTFSASSSTGSIQSTYGANSKVGDITSLGNVWLGSGATVGGSIRSGSSITGAPIGVPVSPNQAITPSTFTWTVPFNTSTNNITQSAGTTTLPAGSYGNVIVNGGTLVLNSGTYYFDSLTLQSSSKVTVNNASSPTFLYVKTSLAYRTTLTATAANLMLVYFGSTGIAMETPFKGTLIAPNASVRFAVGGVPHSGSGFGKTILVDPDVKFTRQTFSRWDLVPFDVGVTPTVNCVAQLDGSTYGAVFGYSNTTGNSVTLGAGSHNSMSANGPDAGQPILFVPGTVPIATFQTFSTGGQQSWTLGSHTVVAAASSPACSAELKTALVQLFQNDADARSVRAQVTAILANPHFAAYVAAIKTYAGPQLTPFQSSSIDALNLVIANVDLLADRETLTAAQLARLSSFRSSLLANPAVARLRLAGDALRGNGALASQCDAFLAVNRAQPLQPFLPVQAGSVYSQIQGLATSSALAAQQSKLASVAAGAQNAAILAASGLSLAGLLAQSDLAALDLAGPIPTSLFGKILAVASGVVTGAVTGAIAGAAAGPWGIVGGAVIGGIVGGAIVIAGSDALDADACSVCNDDSACGDRKCAGGCCASLPDVWGSYEFLTGTACPSGEAACHTDADCGGGLQCIQACCVSPPLVLDLCPGNSCTTSADCSNGNTCQYGCCAGPCGVNGVTCHETSSSSCGIPATTCPDSGTCESGCCKGPTQPPPH
jgi:hypothetical protein